MDRGADVLVREQGRPGLEGSSRRPSGRRRVPGSRNGRTPGPIESRRCRRTGWSPAGPVPRPERRRDPDRRQEPGRDGQAGDRRQEAQRMHGAGQEPDRPEGRASATPAPRARQIAPRILARRISRPVSGVAIRPSQVSRSRSSTRHSAAAPARTRT